MPESRDSLSRAVALRTGLGPALTAVKGPQSAEVRAFYTESLGLCDRLGDSPDRVELSTSGLQWEALDEDISVAGLLAGIGDLTRATPIDA